MSYFGRNSKICFEGNIFLDMGRNRLYIDIGNTNKGMTNYQNITKEKGEMTHEKI